MPRGLATEVSPIRSTRQLGKRIVDDKKAQLQASKEGSTPEGRDLLSLLIKSIMALENSKEGISQGMSEEEVLGRKYLTFLLKSLKSI